jgi:hypothetical protein
MKKITRLIAGIIAITLFSFFKNAQLSVLKKVGKNLYELKTTNTLNAPDKARLKAIITKQYGIRSFSQTITVHYIPEKGLKGNGVAMADEKLSDADFTATIIEDGDEDVKQSCIFSNCSNNPAIGDILQILSNYNIN